jgi:hypothetical protein
MPSRRVHRLRALRRVFCPFAEDESSDGTGPTRLVQQNGAEDSAPLVVALAASAVLASHPTDYWAFASIPFLPFGEPGIGVVRNGKWSSNWLSSTSTPSVYGRLADDGLPVPFGSR